jgi:hypothetical protein
MNCPSRSTSEGSGEWLRTQNVPYRVPSENLMGAPA